MAVSTVLHESLWDEGQVGPGFEHFCASLVESKRRVNALFKAKHSIQGSHVRLCVGSGEPWDNRKPFPHQNLSLS